MTAVSIPQASVAPAAGPTKTGARSTGDASSGSPAFKDVLGTASDELKKKDDPDTPEDLPKHEQSLTLSATAAIFAAMLPAMPAGDFGLPSAGDQAGPAPNGTADTASAPVQAPDMEVPLEVSTDAAPRADESGIPQPELAFALRLSDVTPAAAKKPVLVSAPRVETTRVAIELDAPLKLRMDSDSPLLPQRAVPPASVEVTKVEMTKVAIEVDAPLKLPPPPQRAVPPGLVEVTKVVVPINPGPAPAPELPVAPRFVDATPAAIETNAPLRLPIDPGPALKPTPAAAETLAPSNPPIDSAAIRKIEVADVKPAPLSLPAQSKSQPEVAPRLPDAVRAVTETDAPLGFKPAPASRTEQSAVPEPVALPQAEVAPPARRNTTVGQMPASEAAPRPAPEAPIAPIEKAENRGSSLSDNRAPAKDDPAPKAEQPKAVRPNAAAVEPAALRHSSADAGPEYAGPKESVAPASNVAPAIAISSPSTLRAPDASSRTAVAASSEPPAPTAPAPRPDSRSEVTEVSLTVPGARADSGADERIAIRMVQRGGEIHVAVRTPDQQAAQSMRSDLTRLAASLDDAGFRTDSWRPAGASVAAPSSAHGQREFSQQSRQGDTTGGDAQPDKQDQRSPGEQKRRQQDERPQWVAELEKHGN